MAWLGALLALHQALQFGANVIHASGDHHLSGAPGRLSRINNAQYSKDPRWPACRVAAWHGTGILPRCNSFRGGCFLSAQATPEEALPLPRRTAITQRAERRHDRANGRIPPAAGGNCQVHDIDSYINMVFLIKPTAKPSISNASPGSTTMVS
jgi:hypothetical protein